LILDCFFSGSVLRGASDIPESLVILSASGPTVSDIESAEQNEGVFTHYLIKGLRTGDADLDGDGSVTFDELLIYAKGQVQARVEHQVPRLFSFAERPVIAARTARHVFISYSRTDSSFAEALRHRLIAAGHKVWVDEQGISGGDDWQVRIGSAIDGSKAVVAILSPEAFSSTWVRRELNYADKAGKPIFPVVCMRCDIPSWYELQFGGLQRLDCTAVDHQGALEILLESIRRILRTSSTVKSGRRTG
jgi:TIR domain